MLLSKWLSPPNGMWMATTGVTFIWMSASAAVICDAIELSLIELSMESRLWLMFFFFQAEDGIRDGHVTGVQTCALPISKEKNAHFLVTPKTGASSGGVPQCGTPFTPGVAAIPQRAVLPGEQYRFHFDMTKCIGCKCCVVACNEQNGNPADINWRRVGEIEGGWYPNTYRSYLSMGCNHCMEPTCLEGCPVDAYSKDPVTGIVLYSAEACIGCQYCTWNCSYGLPEYNAERGVVGKCDMCHGRLAEGREPACVNACPTGSIRIEIVKTAEWKQEYAVSANAPGLPSAD